MNLNKLLPTTLMIAGVALISVQFAKSKTAPQGRKVSNVDPSHKPFFPDKLKVEGKKTSDKTAVLLNDPDINKNWGLKVSEALKARGITEGSKNVVVAVIDTGMDIKHTDLKNNVWINPGESGVDANGIDKATNGIDDDKNGFVDDINGWNFVNNSNRVDDNHGHGTHIAGIIGAEGGNGFGITGISSKVSLMILKYYDPRYPSNNLENTIKAIKYATAMKAQIINYSGGGLDYSQQEFEAIRTARSQGILFVAAAGNEHSNSDQRKYYPANYGLDNIISVTAINPQLQVLSSSNYGVQTVDIAAPGEDIYSTLPGNIFGTLTGTSQATAFVTGLAVLVKANNSEFNYSAIKNYILKTGDDYPWLRSKTGTSKKLNIYKALTTFDNGVAASGALAANMQGMDSAFNSDPSQNTLINETGSASNQVMELRNFMKVMGDSRMINNQ